MKLKKIQLFVALPVFMAAFISVNSAFAEEAKVQLVISEETKEEEEAETAETTTVTPAVPDTGENGFSGVGAAAMVSVITIVVAVILALMIKKAMAVKTDVVKSVAQKNADARRMERMKRIGLSGTVTAAVLTLLTFLFASAIVTPKVEVKDATLVTDPEISVAELEDVKIALSKGKGLSGLNSHELKVKTNSPDGYTVSISTKTEETGLVSESTSEKVKSIGGTLDAPKVLTENTWGFSMKEGSEEPTIGSKWAGVTAEPKVIVDTTAPNYDAEAVDIYFAANVSEELPAGTYENIIVYSVLAKTDVSTIPAPTIDSITPASGTVMGGTRVTLVGDNYTKNGNSITTKVLIGDAECTDVEVYADMPTAGKDTIICTAPEHDGVNDRVDVKVETWGGEATLEKGFRYDVSEIIYVTPDIASTTAGAVSGPAFTIYGEGFANEENPAVKVKIGDNYCEEIQVVSNAQITCTKGPNSGLTAGDKRVLVIHADGGISGNTVKVSYSDTNYLTFSDAMTCDTTKAIYRDVRDSQLYYVAKMADGKCWMVDNLKYAGAETGTLAQVEGQALSADKTSNSTAGNYEVAKYVDPNTQSYCMGTTNVPALTVTRCGMLYNWYAATVGTGNDTLKTAGENAAGSICPAGMKLPSSIMPTTDYGAEATFAAADYPILVASMNAGVPTAGTLSNNSYNWFAGVQPAGAWSGTFSGFWGTKYVNLGRQGYFWSSSSAVKPDNKLRAHYLSFTSGEVRTGDASYANDTRNYGFAVRCVEE